ncbi:methionine/alanine import family NSS transporter small subunit [Demequina sp. TTPB684]|uniref:methionine/alanine import family NSS transporter small subunit n=1 Tax=unclassified Demequina TaxID=2620311 RepID=UPI001CF3574D|nr:MULTISPECIES: methionine/alanine import family NSS transporter small subunit [unclassified Demequina]MCB2411954.1 methionine/alanine import family NSS transporter small subunit [Demequina sp. TTPB684]UPU87154.1 methionine/alanine import family NSS transporter small subunit [Demequina sp. TMPB413]
MTPSAIILFVLAAVLVWGGLIASTIHLIRRPEASHYPAGGDDDERDEHAVIVHDT